MVLPALGTAAPAISSQGEGTGGLGRLHRAHPEGDLVPGRSGAEGRPRRGGLQRRRLVDGHGPGGAPATGERAGETWPVVEEGSARANLAEAEAAAMAAKGGQEGFYGSGKWLGGFLGV